MRFRLFAFIFTLICCVLITLKLSEPTVSAQTQKAKTESQRDSDLKLFDTISSLTRRSTDDLTELSIKGNGTTLSLDGRYQNVLLGKLDADGEPAAACITDIREADHFLGRDLKTGTAIASTDLVREQDEAAAKLHGMTVQEYKFYSRLADQYAAGMIINSPGSATFNIINNDGAGEGFNDPAAAFVVGEGGNAGTTLGQQRLNVFNTAAAIWGAFLDSAVPTNISSQFNPLTPCSSSGGVLGSAGAVNIHRNFAGAPYASTWYHAALANKLAGSDLLPGTAEISAQFNSSVDTGCLGAGTRFYYGLDNATPAGRINLLVVLLHEIGHGVGFSSFVNGSTGVFPGTPAGPDIYSKFMYDRSVALFWDQMTNAQRQTSALNTNNVFWDGPNLRSASSYLTGGIEAATGRVALYTPNPFQGGSSISHFSTAAAPNLLMEPNINSGLSLTLDLSRQVMRDIGWYRDTTADNVADTITTVTPTGSFVIVGQSQPINWLNTGGFSRNVTIELSTDGGTTYSTIAADVANTGNYPWTVPNTLTTQARIRVREAGFMSPAGVSAINFSILAVPAAAPASVSGRVFDLAGRPVTRAAVILAGASGQSYSARTNTFGYFVIQGVPTGQTYAGTISAKGMRFDTFTLSLTDSVSGLEFRPMN